MATVLKNTMFILVAGTMFFTSCKKESSCGNCREANKPPVSKAGKDIIIVLPTDTFTLDGSTSNDPDGTIISYKWVRISGPVSPLIIHSDSSKTLVKSLSPGMYTFELTVRDNGGLSAKDTVQVEATIVQFNRQPVANAGADQTIMLPTNTILLDGAGSSDPDNNMSAYKWTKISGPLLFNISNENAIQSSVINLIQGEYRFELNVTDSGGLSSKDTLVVYVVENMRGYEVIYNGVWGCNDLCRDGDVYWDSSPWNDHFYFDPTIPLEVSIRLGTTTTWIDVHEFDSPLPSINQFYWQINRGYLWVFAYEGKFINTKVTIKVKFL